MAVCGEHGRETAGSRKEGNFLNRGGNFIFEGELCSMDEHKKGYLMQYADTGTD